MLEWPMILHYHPSPILTSQKTKENSMWRWITFLERLFIFENIGHFYCVFCLKAMPAILSLVCLHPLQRVFLVVYMYMVDRVMVVQSESIHYSAKLPNLLWKQYIKLSKKYCSTGRYIISLPYMDTIYQTVKNVLQSWSIY